MFGIGKKSKKELDQTEEQNNNADKGLMTETPKQEKVEEIPPLLQKDFKALKRSRYEEIHHRFNTAYVIKNKKTGQIAEIRAASAVHAANLIGWRPNRVKLIETKIPEEIQDQSPEAIKLRTAEPVIQKEVKRNKQPETIAATPIENCPGLQ